MRIRIRDSKTGKYISAEEADKLTPERFVVERDAENNDKLLKQILEELKVEAVVLANVPHVNIEAIRAVFLRHGLK